MSKIFRDNCRRVDDLTIEYVHARHNADATNPAMKGKPMSNAEASHKAAVTKEIASMTGRNEIEARMAAETNTTVKIWIWQYLQTL